MTRTRLILRVPTHALMTLAKAHDDTPDYDVFAKAYRRNPNTYAAFKDHDGPAPVGLKKPEWGKVADDARDNWLSKIGDEGKAAVTYYTDQKHGGPRLNRGLRGQETMSAETTAHMHHLDQALQHPAAKVTHPGGIVVHRGISGGYAQGLVEKHLHGGLVGSLHHEPGYTSTSMDRSIGHKFGPQWMPSDAPTVIHHVIHLPNGTRAACVTHASEYKHEHEMLLPRGTTLQHVKMERSDVTDEMRQALKKHAVKTGHHIQGAQHWTLHSVVVDQDHHPDQR